MSSFGPLQYYKLFSVKKIDLRLIFTLEQKLFYSLDPYGIIMNVWKLTTENKYKNYLKNIDKDKLKQRCREN